MKTTPDVQITIDFRNPDLDDEELEKLTQSLLDEMRELDEVTDVKRVLDPNSPKGSKAVGAVLIGWLMTQVNPNNIKALFGFLGDRLGNKPIELEVEANGKKLKVTASSQQELLAAVQSAQQFVESS
jgi:hypothetical protein